MAEELGKMMNKKVVILTNDGRTFTGMLRGVDQVTNLILEDVEERIFSQTEPMRVEKYDVYLFRGDDTSLIGLYSEEKDGQVNWPEVRADPVGPITHYSCLFKQSILPY